MANLTAAIDTQESDGREHWYLMATNIKLYAGAFVVVNASGYAADMIGGTASQLFVGTCLETTDNTGGANGAKRVKVRRLRGHIETRVATGLTQASVGLPAYAADDNTITTTAGTNTQIGYIVEYLSATSCRVAIHPTA